MVVEEETGKEKEKKEREREREGEGAGRREKRENGQEEGRKTSHVSPYVRCSGVN